MENVEWMEQIREIKHTLCKYFEAAVAQVDGSVPDSYRLHINVSVRKTVNVCDWVNATYS